MKRYAELICNELEDKIKNLSITLLKSKIAMMILDKIHHNYDKIYILVNADRLRDFTWKEDFEKWGRSNLLEKVTLINYQSMHKTNEDLYRVFVIADEIDYAIGTPVYGTFFTNYPKVHMLGLTGYCAESKRAELEQVCPVIAEYTFDQAVEEGVLNEVKFHFLKFDLNKSKFDIEVKYKKNGIEKSFHQSENDAYDYADKAFRIAYGLYENALADLALGAISTKEYDKLDNDMKRKRDARLKILYNGIASRIYTKKLQEAILVNTNNKVITFSRYTTQCDKLNKETYHSKNTNELNLKNIDDFNVGIIRSLGVCSKLDRGENLKGLNNIILESYTSSDTVLSQRRGRGARLGVHETANVYIMLPYYMRKNADGTYTQAATQAITWANNMLKNEDMTDVTIHDYRTIKSDL